MAADFLQLILDFVSAACSFDFALVPVLVMAAFALVFRLILRRYN